MFKYDCLTFVGSVVAAGFRYNVKHPVSPPKTDSTDRHRTATDQPNRTLNDRK